MVASAAAHDRRRSGCMGSPTLGHTRLTVLVLSAVALALVGSAEIFARVLFAWTAMGAAFVLRPRAGRVAGGADRPLRGGVRRGAGRCAPSRTNREESIARLWGWIRWPTRAAGDTVGRELGVGRQPRVAVGDRGREQR
ncbi:MAG: hypothetical protein AAGF11_46490 [Myxococcota bacterium]